MGSEFWFYATTILICIGYALLMQRYPGGKIYFSIGLAVFVTGGSVLVYLDVKKREDSQTKMDQMHSMLEEAKKEAEKQTSLTKDMTDRAHVLGEQLKAKTEELGKVLKNQPRIDGEISKVRLFPWQRASDRDQPRENQAAATGILVFARVENSGSATALANWELNIRLPDNTIVKPQKWPEQMGMRILCEDGPIHIPKDGYLDAKSKQALSLTAQRSGVTVWVVKNVPQSTVRKKDAVYTLTARDDTGMVHALDGYNLASLPQACFGFEPLN